MNDALINVGYILDIEHKCNLFDILHASINKMALLKKLLQKWNPLVLWEQNIL